MNSSGGRRYLQFSTVLGPLRFCALASVALLVAAVSSIILSEVAQAVTINLEKTPKSMPAKKKLLPVILDARPAFSFATGHVFGSANIRWKDYSQTDLVHFGALDPDYDLLARKLRILGVAPGVQVTVIGAGPAGDGSEGRIAWMLKFLGVENINILNYANVPGKKTVEEGLPHESASIWLAHPVDSLRITKRELDALVKNHDVNVVLIDVRDADEFVGKTGETGRKGHLPGAINISWKEFFNQTGDVMSADNVVGVFRNHHVDVAKTLVFYSNEGVRSGFVTFLAAQAKLIARNYDGSLVEWTADSQSPLEK